MYREMSLDQLRQIFKPKTRIKLIKMIDDMVDKYHVAPNTLGTVISVDDARNVQMRWDNGQSLNLIPDVDQFEILGR